MIGTSCSLKCLIVAFDVNSQKKNDLTINQINQPLIPINYIPLRFNWYPLSDSNLGYLNFNVDDISCRCSLQKKKFLSSISVENSISLTVVVYHVPTNSLRCELELFNICHLFQELCWYYDIQVLMWLDGIHAPIEIS